MPLEALLLLLLFLLLDAFALLAVVRSEHPFQGVPLQGRDPDWLFRDRQCRRREGRDRPVVRRLNNGVVVGQGVVKVGNVAAAAPQAAQVDDVVSVLVNSTLLVHTLLQTLHVPRAFTATIEPETPKAAAPWEAHSHPQGRT